MELEPEFDDIVIGTDLAQAILAAALSHQGRKVLHIDKSPLYNSRYAMVRWRDLQDTLLRQKCRDVSIHGDLDCQIPLRPMVISTPMKESFLDLLLQTSTHNGLSFHHVNHIWLLNEDFEIQRVCMTKAQVFEDKVLSLHDKRKLMRLAQSVQKNDVLSQERNEVGVSGSLKDARVEVNRDGISSKSYESSQSSGAVVLEHAHSNTPLRDGEIGVHVSRMVNQPSSNDSASQNFSKDNRSYSDDPNHLNTSKTPTSPALKPAIQSNTNSTAQSYTHYLHQTLTPHLASMVQYGINMSLTDQELRTIGLIRTRQYLSAPQRLGGPTGFVCLQYGASELSQAFCRFAAVRGCVYVMGREFQVQREKEHTFVDIAGLGRTKTQRVISERLNERVEVQRTVIVCSSLPDILKKAPEVEGAEWDNNVLVYPGSPFATQILIQNHTSGFVERGQWIVVIQGPIDPLFNWGKIVSEEQILGRATWIETTHTTSLECSVQSGEDTAHPGTPSETPNLKITSQSSDLDDLALPRMTEIAYKQAQHIWRSLCPDSEWFEGLTQPSLKFQNHISASQTSTPHDRPRETLFRPTSGTSLRRSPSMIQGTPTSIPLRNTRLGPAHKSSIPSTVQTHITDTMSHVVQTKPKSRNAREIISVVSKSPEARWTQTERASPVDLKSSPRKFSDADVNHKMIDVAEGVASTSTSHILQNQPGELDSAETDDEEHGAKTQALLAMKAHGLVSPNGKRERYLLEKKLGKTMQSRSPRGLRPHHSPRIQKMKTNQPLKGLDLALQESSVQDLNLQGILNDIQARQEEDTQVPFIVAANGQVSNARDYEEVETQFLNLVSSPGKLKKTKVQGKSTSPKKGPPLQPTEQAEESLHHQIPLDNVIEDSQLIIPTHVVRPNNIHSFVKVKKRPAQDGVDQDLLDAVRKNTQSKSKRMPRKDGEANGDLSQWAKKSRKAAKKSPKGLSMQTGDWTQEPEISEDEMIMQPRKFPSSSSQTQETSTMLDREPIRLVRVTEIAQAIRKPKQKAPSINHESPTTIKATKVSHKQLVQDVEPSPTKVIPSSQPEERSMSLGSSPSKRIPSSSQSIPEEVLNSPSLRRQLQSMSRHRHELEEILNRPSRLVTSASTLW